MLFRLSNSFFVKNYISVQNLLNDVKIIEDWCKNMFHYHFCFNKNKQTVISVIINKSLTFIKITCMNCIFLFWSFLHLHFLLYSHIWIRSSIQSLASQKIELMHDMICRWIWRSLQLKRSLSFRSKTVADHAENQIIKALIRSASFMAVGSSTSWLLAFTNSLTLKKARQKKHSFWSKSWSETNWTRNC